MRLIDIEAPCKIEIVLDGEKCHATVTAPTVDAVPVVRCKDCRWGKEVSGNVECWVDINVPPEYHGYEWFCPNGERKDNDLS